MKLRNLIGLSLLLASSTAMAQVAVLPSSPNPPEIVATSPNELEANAVSTTNKVYIDQSGNNVSVNVVQTGVSNVLGTSADPVYLRGDNQTLIAIQTGNLNSALISVVSGTGQTGVANITLQQLGNSNSAIVRCGNGEAEANCNALDLNVKFTGNYNSLNFHGAGSNIRNAMDVSGNNNTFNIEVTSPNATQTISVLGDYNNFDLTQTGTGGTYGHSFTANITGTGNSITSNQYGSSETVVNVTSVGSNGTFNIKTGH